MSLKNAELLVVHKTCETPKVRLVCFPHSGGAPSTFSAWPDHLDEHGVEVVSISLPGRERRLDEKPFLNMSDLSQAVYEALTNSGVVDGVPYAFFGHSLGAIVAYEVAQRLEAELAPGRPRPVHLFASGHGAPAGAGVYRIRTSDIPWGTLHELADEELIATVAKFGFLPPTVTEDVSLMKIVVKALRADFTLYETYRPDDARTPLNLPITAMGGNRDYSCSPEVLKSWASYTKKEFAAPELFPGDHFFIDTATADVLKALRGKLEASMDMLPRSLLRSSLPELECCWTTLMQDLVRKNAAEQPEMEAAVDDYQRLTYPEVVKRMELIAVHLHAKYLHGDAGAIVALTMPHDADYLVSMFGIWCAAATIIAIEAHFPNDLCVEVCEECNTKAAIVSPQHIHKFDKVPGCGILVLQGDWWDALAKENLQSQLPVPKINDPCVLMFTSGTTGRPKTISCSHFFLHYCCTGKTQFCPYVEDDDREAFNVMFVGEAPKALVQGKTAFLIPDAAVLDPQLFVSSLQKHKCTRALTTPSLLATIIQVCGDKLAERLPDMRTWYMEGEVLPMRTVAKFEQIMPKCSLVNCYSTWEAGDIAFARVLPRPAYEPSDVVAVAGIAAPGCNVVVLDPETKRIVPVGCVGEVYIGGPSLSDGYYQRADITAEKFVQAPEESLRDQWQGLWYKTGDLGRLIGEPPVLEIRGRIDSTVKVRGFKVGLPLVESTVAEVNGVAVCGVFPIWSSPGVAESLLCFVGPQPGFDYEELISSIKKACSSKLPRFMVPSHWRPMPASALGSGEARKLDRRRLGELAKEAYEEAPPVSDEKLAQLDESKESGLGGVLRKVWSEILNLNPQTLDEEESFFDLGGHSALAAQIAAKLSSQYGLSVTVLDIYEHSTLGSLTAHLEPKKDEPASKATGRRVRSRNAAVPGVLSPTSSPRVAVVGVAGRFPGADDPDAFWQNLMRGTVSATFISPELLQKKGVPEDIIGNKEFVPCAYMVNDVDKFDHLFFGIGKHEASIMDPQHRLFIEASWAALENAAISPKGGLNDTVVGVFAAAGIDGYLVHHLDGAPLKNTMDPNDVFLAEIGNEKDYIATRVSYLFDFTGPAMNVNSACSAALVACCQGASAIISQQCDAAIAGGSSITFPNLGYRYQEGLVASVDGYVRPFDAAADGTVFGDSVGAVVLRNVQDVASKDPVWGVMQGWSVTNDGGQKAGYAAPSPVGQSHAIRNALDMMGEDPWSVSYVECHCTGTRVGDGIEIRGLLDAFSQASGNATRDSSVQVALGSVKGNIGHANCAAGVTGLTKVLLTLRSKQLVPTANFKKLNPKIDLSDSPFFVNTELCNWDAGSKPFRAGVSSFGIGGTNAHIVLQEWPERDESVEPKKRWAFHVLPLSAKSPETLRRTSMRLAAGLEAEVSSVAEGPTALTEAAFTLQTGRAAFPFRKAAIVSAENGDKSDLKVAAQALKDLLPEDDEELEEMEESVKRPSVAFLFPGQGSQYYGMGRGLYKSVPLFREATDRCCDHLKAPDLLNFDLREVLFPDTSDTGDVKEQERQQAFAKASVLQPALFVVEYALAQVLLAVGVTPVAMAGHSLGEYSAACVGGLISLETACNIVATRAKATESLAEDGAMLSVAGWSQAELDKIEQGERQGLWLAGVNSPEHAVISGEEAAVDALEQELRTSGRKCTRLHVKKAFHSGLIAKAADTLKGKGQTSATASSATIPVACNLTGGWLTSVQLQGLNYWTDHMRGTVRWRDNAEKLLAQWNPAAVLEVGPGNALSTLTAKCVGDGPKPVFFQGMRHPKATGMHDVEALMRALAQLWEVGCAVDWHALHTTVLGEVEVPKAIRLPPTPLDRISIWVNPERSIYVDETPDPAPLAYQGGAGAGAVAAPAYPGLVRFVDADELTSKPALRAYCLPFASGSSVLFAPWSESAGPAVEVVCLELPGRGVLSEQKMPSSDADDDRLLEALCGAILADVQGAEYVLVGCSMGGNLCVELALRLASKGKHLPLAVYVAGRKPPADDPNAVPEINMSNEELAEYAFAPPEVAQSQEFTEHVVPLLRADLELDMRVERRLSTSARAGVKLPSTIGFEAFCGTCDTVAPWSEAPGWQRLVEAPVGVHYYPGGHEFMREQRPMLLSAWRRDALSRLVQLRSAELAALSELSVSVPSATSKALPPPITAQRLAPPAPAVTEARLPLYAVRWAQAQSKDVVSEASKSSVCLVDLSSALSDGALQEATTTMQAGGTVVACCPPVNGALRFQPLGVEVSRSWQFVRLVQGLLEAGLSGRLIVACPAGQTGALVAGASKAVAMEAGELQVRRVFLSAAHFAKSADMAQEMCALVDRFPGDSDLWLDAEGSMPFTQRLEAMSEPNLRLPCVPQRNANGDRAVYVLTGATGGLGSAVVDWLLKDQGLLPEQLVLLRRENSKPLEGSLASCREVCASALDDSDTLLVSELSAVTGVAGIFHLAGVLDDGVISGMTEERLRNVAQPKCGILMALLRVGRCFQWPLQWALGFSSTSSLFGYAGQLNYCAANALLDHMAAFGQARRIPEAEQPPCRVIAINWGPWGEAGMAKVGTKAYEQAVKEGDTPLSTATALRCLAASLRTATQALPGAVQFCACDVDWQKSQWKGLPVLDLVSEPASEEEKKEVSGKPAQIGDSVATRVESFLLEHTKGTSWKRIEKKSLFQLGLDSLEVVQLRNAFNKKFGMNVPMGIVADPSQQVGKLASALAASIPSN